MKNLKTNPELLRLLRDATKRPMTREELDEQAVSFVYGQLMDCAPDVTREQVEAIVKRRRAGND